jgi:hypothetical protein
MEGIIETLNVLSQGREIWKISCPLTKFELHKLVDNKNTFFII